MTHKQMQQLILRRKGAKSWREFGEEVNVAFTDLWSASKHARTPKIGVLRALKLETVTETRYRALK